MTTSVESYPTPNDSAPVIIICTLAAVKMGEKLAAALERRGVDSVLQELSQFISGAERRRVEAAVFINAQTSIGHASELPPEIREYLAGSAVRKAYVYSAKKPPSKRAASKPSAKKPAQPANIGKKK